MHAQHPFGIWNLEFVWVAVVMPLQPPALFFSAFSNPWLPAAQPIRTQPNLTGPRFFYGNVWPQAVCFLPGFEGLADHVVLVERDANIPARQSRNRVGKDAFHRVPLLLETIRGTRWNASLPEFLRSLRIIPTIAVQRFGTQFLEAKRSGSQTSLTS